jgi:hypothetical protein
VRVEGNFMGLLVKNDARYFSRISVILSDLKV